MREIETSEHCQTKVPGAAIGPEIRTGAISDICVCCLSMSALPHRHAGLVCTPVVRHQAVHLVSSKANS